MKRIVAFALLGLFSFGVCFAQDFKEALRQDPARAAGLFYVYDTASLPAPTVAPKGYKPFYISQFARHGARYCTSEYDAVHGWFEKASEARVLTDAGKVFRQRYESFYQKVKNSKGNLTRVGKNQHRAIAGRLVERFPQVFKGPTHVEAVSTESARVILSMWSFLSSLQAKDRNIDFNADASAKYASWLQPIIKTNPFYIKGGFDNGKAAEDAFNAYFEATVPWKEIAGRFFTGEDVLKGTLKTTPAKFFECMHAVVTGTANCLDEDRDYFDDVFSAEDLFLIWKGLSAHYFLDCANYTESQSLILDYAAFTLGQIIESADADIASGSTQLRLRFGHDSGISPLMILLNANGFGRATASFEQSLEIFPSYNLPMGATVQFVFYRNKAGNILLKVLVNEREATLPLKPVQGPYYGWNDFKAHYGPIIAASKAKIEKRLAEN